MTRKVFIFLILLVFTASANMLSTSGETFAEDMLSFSSLEPAPVSTSISDYSTVSGGGTHSVFLKSDGTVWSWGNNWRGQLGDGTVKNKNKRVQVSGVKGIKAISAGAEHTVALKDDGTVWTWGNNNSGQLGDSSTQNRYSPVQGLYLTGAKGIAAGGLHSVALKEDGTVWVWGDNYYGQLGTGNTMNSIIPVMIADTNNVKDVAAGFSHTILLKDDGTVWACGYNDYGQLGDGTNLHSSTPVQVKGLSGVKAIAAGGYHSMALKEDGTVWVWGSSVNGQAGDGSTGIRLIPAQVSGISIVNAIAAGGYHSMALKEDGTVWAWGSNSHGQIGDGVSGSKLIPVQVKGLSNVKAISGGDYHSAVLKNDKTVWTWGWNSYGQLGDGTNTNKNIPVQTEETLNNPPSIGFIGDKTVDEGSLLEFGINAIDLDGDSLTYSVPILPYGAAFDPVLRIFSWIPDYTQAGVYFVSFEVKDALTSSILTIMITVNNVNQPPKANAGEEITVEATSSKGAQVILNGSYSFDPDGDDLVYFWEGPFGIIQEAAPTVTVPLGVNRIMLTVSDGELTNTSEVIIKVVDTKPPEVTIEGIADGFDYTDSVIPQILINDFESGINTSQVLLDGKPYIPGTAIDSPGNHTLAVTAADYAGNTTVNTIRFSIYSSTIIEVTALPSEFSDLGTIKAVLTSKGSPVPNKEIVFKINDSIAGKGITAVDGSTQFTFSHNLAKGTYPVSVHFAQDNLSYLRPSEGIARLEIHPEKAVVAYTGQLLVQYSSVVNLSARIIQDSDGSFGDLSLAKISFTVRMEDTNGTMIDVGTYMAQCDSLGNASVPAMLDVGVYSVSIKISDDGYYSPYEDTVIVSVYDPDGGFATGGGWINVTNPIDGNIGRSYFGFIVRYKDSQSTGNLSLNYSDGGLVFKSTRIDWLIISSTSAQFRGVGTIQGLPGDYTFQINCTDNNGSLQPDKFTIKIWQGHNTDVEPVYKALNQSLSGGNILVKAR